MSKVIVVGGGAAGMLSAISAADAGCRVTLIEANEKLGKKVYITGKGRCNVTNACEAEDFFANVVKNPKFLYSAFYTFDNNRIQELIEEGGCALKTERGGRVFPVSDHSSDVLRSLSNLLKMRKVEVILNCKVLKLLTNKQDNVGVCPENGEKQPEKPAITGVITDSKGTLYADKVILATGGVSYPSTGSTGEGFKLVKALGHTINTCKPSLVPLNAKEHWCSECSGLSLKNVSVRLEAGADVADEDHGPKNKTVISKKPRKKNIIYEGFGEMLFTHWGVSGPLILTASSFYAERSYQRQADLYIDLKPALSNEQLDKRLLRDFEENSNKSLKNAIVGLLPGKLITVVIDESNLNPDKKVCEITRAEREALIHTLKNLHLTITGARGFGEAIITRGGVDIGEINPSTLESKIVSGLYFAGEMIDVDALTGGFNLQIAWSTGYLAGME